MTQPRYAVPILVTIGAVIFAAGFLLRPLSAADAQKKPPAIEITQKAAPATSVITKWEYKVVSNLDPVTMDGFLNGWGAEGWECAGVVSEKNNHVCVVFKRPKQ